MKWIPRTLSGRILAAQFLLLIAIALTFPVWFPRLGYFLVVENKLEKADIILVLGGGDPHRAVTAAALFKDKWAEKVVTTGKIIPLFTEAMGENTTFAQLQAKLVSRHGVPPRDIIVVNSGTSTYEEAQAMKEFAAEKKIKSMIIVTSIFHARRASMVYRKLFKDTNVKIIMRPAFGGAFDTNRWWTRERELIYVNNEWVKLLLYIWERKV